MSDPERAIRIANALCGGVAFAVVTGCCAGFLREKGSGHRALLWVVFAASGIRSLANFLGVWNLYFRGSLSWDVWLFLVTALASCVMASKLLASFPDIRTTLLTSEAEDRNRLRRAAIAQTEREKREHESALARIKSEEILLRQQQSKTP